MKSIEVFGINATVYAHITSNGKNTNVIKINTESGDSIDRVQYASDYRFSKVESSMQLKDGVYTNGHDYIAYSIYPRSNTSVFLLTAKCSDPDLGYDASLVQLCKAMSRAIEYMNKVQ